MTQRVHLAGKGLPGLALLLIGTVVAATMLLVACGSAAPTATPTVEAATSEPVAVSAPVTSVPATSVLDVIPTPTPVGERPVYGGTLRVPLGTFAHPDVWNIVNTGGIRWPRLYYNGLVDIKMPYNATKFVEYVPGLATEWSQSADGSKWTLKLRQGVTFHDGEVFNADDVVATYERTLDPGMASFLAGRLVPMRSLFTSAKKLDDYTVVLDSGEANASAFTYIASNMAMMMPEHLIRGDRNSPDPKLRWKFLHPDSTKTLAVGTGPFRLVKWAPDVETVGERNPNYWRRDALGNQLPYLDKIVWTAIPDVTRNLATFVAGQAHISLGGSTGIHPTKAQQLCRQTRDAGCYVTPHFPHGFWDWRLNVDKIPQFKDERVVQAARYAADNQRNFDLSYGGYQGFMWMDRARFPDTALTVKEQYETIPWSNPARRGEFVQKAKELIVAAGYDQGIDLPFPMFSQCGGASLELFSREVDEFYRVGLKSFLECRAGIVAGDELKAGRWSIADSPAPVFLVDPGHGVISKALLDSPALASRPWPYAGQEAVERLFRQTVKELDPAKRNEGYRNLERLLANDKLTVWAMGYSAVTAAVRGCVKNYGPGLVWESHGFAQEFVWLAKECQ